MFSNTLRSMRSSPLKMIDKDAGTNTVICIRWEDRALLRSNPSAQWVLKHRRGHYIQLVPPSQPTDALAPKRKTCRFSFKTRRYAENAEKRQHSLFVTYVKILCRWQQRANEKGNATNDNRARGPKKTRFRGFPNNIPIYPLPPSAQSRWRAGWCVGGRSG